MRTIDGKPEYKNGLVRKQGLGLGWQGGLPWQGGGGGRLRGTGPQRPGPSPSALPACLPV